MSAIRKLDNCENCDKALGLDDNFCPNCGQENNSQKAPIKALVKDFMGDYFVFDSKLFRSIIPLLFKPGKLSQQFIEGKRASYIKPLRMYIFISIIFFFVVSLSMDSNKAMNKLEVSPTSIKNPTKDNIITINVGEDTLHYNSMEDYAHHVDSLGGIEEFSKTIGASSLIEKITVEQTYKVAKEGGESLIRTFMDKVPLVMFLLLPLFAGLLKLIFRKNKLYYIEHLIVSFHIHSFIFLLQAFYLLFSLYVVDVLNEIIVVGIMTIYTFIAVKKVYPYSVWGTIWRLLSLLLVYNVSLVLVFIATLFISLLLF